jgi:hypothetical protein
MNQLNPFFVTHGWVLVLVLLWSLFWKGCALWIAAKNNQRWWFLALLVINTAGILEIIYIFVIAKKKCRDIKEIFAKSASLEN